MSRRVLRAALFVSGLMALVMGAAGLVKASSPRSPESGGMGMPTGGYVTTLFLEPINYENSGYYYDPGNIRQYANYVFHHGIDVSGGCYSGIYPVYASSAGTVAVAQYLTDGYGSQVIIDHGFNVGGNGRYTYSFYSHMGDRSSGARFILVSPGQTVQAGQLIGYQGNDGSSFGTCQPNPGTHLDWEIRVSSSPVLYGTGMRYSSTAASPDYYTYQQVTYGDVSPATRVVAGPFNNPDPPTSTPVGTWTPGPCGMRFYDVADSFWAYGYISDLFCRTIIGGYPDGTFRPLNANTRGQVSKMIVLGFGWNLYNPYFPTYSDVAPGSTFYQYIETVHLRGVIEGYGDGTFRPSDPISRAETAKALVVAHNWTLIYPSNPTYWDVNRGYWGYPYVETATAHGVVSGRPDGSFGPDASVTRAQLSKMVSVTLSIPLRNSR